MATYLQTVNNVLGRLRESPVGSVTDTPYSLLIGRLVNDAKREVENAWRWHDRRFLKTITTIPGTHQYRLTDGDPSPTGTVIFEAYNTTHDFILRRIDAEMHHRYRQLGTNPDGPVSMYRVIKRDFDTDECIQVSLFPDPTEVETIKFYIYAPNFPLENDSDEIHVPIWPVELGAWTKAISERGEDGGQLYQEADAAYHRALNDTIAVDMAYAPHETDWVPY